MVDKEHPSVSFLRLISDESCSSTVTEDSCLYLQTEILNQLPSSVARRDTNQPQTTETLCPEEEHPGSGGRGKVTTLPLKCLPLCMRRKREVRDLRNLMTLLEPIGRLESWRRSQSLNTRRLGEQLGRVFSNLLPWNQTLHTIEGRFGAGVKAYFVFLRYLVYLNILHCLIIGGAILTPTVIYSNGVTRVLESFQVNGSVLDIFLGSDFLQHSPVFYGFYLRGTLDLLCLNTPLLFMLGTLSVFILSLTMVVRRTVVRYKHSWLLGNRYNIHMSFKVFCAWDFCIQDPDVAAIKLSFIRNELKLYLDEEKFQQREARRTLAQWARLYLLRGLLNILVLALLGGAFSLIYYATYLSQDKKVRTRNTVESTMAFPVSPQPGEHWFLGLLLQYLPPIFITLANFTLPYVFRWISGFEDYSLAIQVNTTLVRSIFLKLASLGIYLFFLIRSLKQDTTLECWENKFGMEMYKLFVFDLLVCFCNTFFISYPYKWLIDRRPSCWLTRLLGEQHFLIPFDVLDLVYSQTVCWVGLFYCPLLPYIGTAKLVAVFYIKKFFVLKCCVPAQRMFRASSSSVLFYVILLLGLVMAGITVATNLHFFDRSPGCGPFAGNETVFNVTAVCVDSLPRPAQAALRYVATEGFFFVVILAQVVVLTSYETRRQANGKSIERLKGMLVMASSDKQFLLKQNTLSLRRQRKKCKPLATAAGTEEANPIPQTPKGPLEGQGSPPIL
ncbi:hypothetical protein DPEC_G00170790 [Dallia pectoralis]|uniref:Uncharacterized protein n=1 Tax=Dallia pectoralis TaxID=75939 RepID=A0ACC2GD08_DALPE|nr:hypothetical protein DPEC_G00170790 [Dallia pectoralis]